MPNTPNYLITTNATDHWLTNRTGTTTSVGGIGMWGRREDNFAYTPAFTKKQPITHGNDSSVLDQYGHQLKPINSLLLKHIRDISELIGTVISEYRADAEWTKRPRYQKWFDKWALVLEDVLYKEFPDKWDRVNFPSNMDAITYIGKVLSSKLFEDKEFDLDEHFKKFDHLEGRYFHKDMKVSFEVFLAFFPEMSSSFANTFLYRVVDMRDGNGKERKITMIDTKLPKNILKLYENTNNGVLDRLYLALKQAIATRGMSDGTSVITSSAHGPIQDFFDKSVIGFIPHKSYMDHVRMHMGKQALITCDINKFYNALNLKTIVDNDLFGAVIDLTFDAFKSTHVDSRNPDTTELTIYKSHIRYFATNLFNTIMYFHTCNGMLPTGSYASPVLSNIMMIPFDLDMRTYCSQKNFTYSRYVDDICISHKEERNKDGKFNLTIENAKDIEKLLNKHGLFLKYKKTKIFGKSDVKVIANLNLPPWNAPADVEPSIGTKNKLFLKTALEGKKYKDLSDQEKGTLAWIKTVNKKQWEFITKDLEMPADKSKAKDPALIATGPASWVATRTHTIAGTLDNRWVINTPVHVQAGDTFELNTTITTG